MTILVKYMYTETTQYILSLPICDVYNVLKFLILGIVNFFLVISIQVHCLIFHLILVA